MPYNACAQALNEGILTVSSKKHIIAGVGMVIQKCQSKDTLECQKALVVHLL